MADSDVSMPDRARTTQGFVFDPSTPIWWVGSDSGSVKFDFNRLSKASPSLRAKFKRALLISIGIRRTSAVRRDFEQVVRLLESITDILDVDQIELSHVDDFVSCLPTESKYLAWFLKRSLDHWAAAGGDGLADDLVRALPDLSYDTHESGRAVRTCCPLKGSLTAEQHDGLLIGLIDAYDSGRSTLANHCMAMMTVILLSRPCQLARLKVCDFRASTGSEPSAVAELTMPRAKQRGVMHPRRQFTTIPLGSDLATLLEGQCREAVTWASSRGIDPKTAPMFFAFSWPGRPLPPRLPGMAGHMEARDVSRRVSRLIERLGVVPGLVAGSRITPVRLRRTGATILADEGVSLDDIAAALDHSGIGAILSYVQQMAGLADRLDLVLGAPYAELVQGFGRSSYEAEA